MRKRSPLTLLLLVLLLTASYVAMSAHEVGHAMGPDDIRQCTLCVKGSQPFTMPVLNKIPERPVVEYFQATIASEQQRWQWYKQKYQKFRRLRSVTRWVRTTSGNAPCVSKEASLSPCRF